MLVASAAFSTYITISCIYDKQTILQLFFFDYAILLVTWSPYYKH